MKAYILIGLIGSGKSGWARMTAGTNFNTLRVSCDDIRNMIKDRYTFDIQLEPLVRSMRNAAAAAILKAGKNVVIDDCNLTREYRRELIINLVEAAGTGIEIIYVWMKCPTDVALKRRLLNLRGRTEFEWTQVMHKMVASFEAPTLAENEYYVKEIIKVNNE